MVGCASLGGDGVAGERLKGLARIRSLYPTLTPAEQKVADQVLADPERAIYYSITELAEAAGVAESTVIRFCQSLGLKGYQAFKLELARSLVDPYENIQSDLKPDDDLGTAIRKIGYAATQAIVDTVKVLDRDELERAVMALVKARRVNFYGVGASGITALDAQYKFLRIGRLAEAYIDPHSQAMAASLLRRGDVAVGISHSGSTKDVVHSCRVAKESGATVIAITNYARSPITHEADIVLLTASPETPLGSSSVRSKIAQLLVLDLLFTGVVLRLGLAAHEALEKTARSVLDKLY